MKKIIYLSAFVMVAALSMASFAYAEDATQFNVSLKYGSTDKAEVMKLQNFLVMQGLLKVAPTGAFLSLTQKAVVDFQKANGVSPASGYFGPLTRAVANQKMLAMSSTGLTTVSSVDSTVSAGKVVSANLGVASAFSANTKTVTWTTTGYPQNAGVNINLIRKTSSNPTMFVFLRTIALDTVNDGQESWTPQASENTGDVYVEVTCSNTYKFKSGCKLGGAPIKVD